MLLALDLATSTGFCAPDVSGRILLKDKKHSALYGFLWDIHAAYQVETIAVERTAGAHVNSLIFMSRLRGVVELFAERHDIKVVDYSPKTVKKHFTGNGNSGKPGMIDEFVRRKGKQPITDDEADAYALFCLAAEELYPSQKFPVIVTK